MTAIRQPTETVWDGPDRVYADRLLAHCLAVQIDPPAVQFTHAVQILRALSGAVSVVTYIPLENRVEQHAVLCAAALLLSGLAL